MGIQTNFRNGVKTFPRDSTNTKIKTAAYTVLAADCIGSTIIVDSNAAAVMTLPLIAGAVDGGIVTIVNNKRGQLLTVDPNASDGINFGDQVADGVTVVNTAATAQKGDFIKLATLTSASTYWSVVDISGIWAVGA
jgi:ethanolamine transporter EutH